MFKGRIENKAATPAPDAIEIDGKRYRRADFEDPDRPGFTRAGRLYSSAELRCCGLWDLISPSGRRMSAHLPIARPRDPRVVTGADVPAELREAAESARARLEEIRSRSSAALERRSLAEAARRRAFDRRDKEAVVEAESAYKQAEQERRDIEPEEFPVRRQISEADWKIKRWMWDEGLRRQGRA